MTELVELHEIIDPRRGSLCVAEAEREVPFPVRRVFYMHDMPLDSERGHHAHRLQHQFVIAIHGTLSVAIDSKAGAESFKLDRPGLGLHVPPLTWLVVHALTAGAVCLVLASEHFDEVDYIRDRAEFDRLIRA